MGHGRVQVVTGHEGGKNGLQPSAPELVDETSGEEQLGKDEDVGPRV